MGNADEVNELEIVQHLLGLPEEARKHLFSTYSDAAALSGEMIKNTGDRDDLHELKKRHSVYVRIAKTLLDSIGQQ